ncbi:hypothetical protein ACIQUM_15675 [Amycolatopsis azurea]|uniref:hypothetical protein n=1 Tax=Amycolatopsis azurea TaxID=36819 RepID=UPI0037F48226
MVISTYSPPIRVTENAVPIPDSIRAESSSWDDHPKPVQNCHGPRSPPTGTLASLRWPSSAP